MLVFASARGKLMEKSERSEWRENKSLLTEYLGNRKLEGNGPVEPAASRAIEDKHVVQ